MNITCLLLYPDGEEIPLPLPSPITPGAPITWPAPERRSHAVLFVVQVDGVDVVTRELGQLNPGDSLTWTPVWQ